MIKSRNLFLLLIIFIIFVGCKKKEERINEEKFAFGTYIKLSIYSNNEKQAKKIMNSAFDEIERIDTKYNSKTKGSLVDILNVKGKSTFDAEGLYLLKEVNKAYLMSNKKYDITMGPLMDAWGFSETSELRTTLPTPKELDKAALEVDYSNLKVEGNNIKFLKNGMELDTGSFLKGYAVEKAKELMIKEGVKSGFVSSISSIAAIGGKGDGSPWRIGIQNPDNPSDILGIVELKNQSMGVSGDYQTYVTIGGKRYHHIIDKETKYPVNDKRMVVVVNNNSLISDLYSTAFFLMPINKVMEIADRTQGLEVLIVDINNKIHLSKNFKFEKKQ